jgi:GNAT superfamily N-acetyltransferase
MTNASALNLAVSPHLQNAEIRTLKAADHEIYRALRNRIRKSPEGRFFSDSYEREDQLTESQWLEWCREKPEHCIFGTFIGNELIGIVMVTQYGPPEDRTAEWEATWLDPRYRGTGIISATYEKVRDWTEAQGYATVKVFIRDDPQNKHWRDVRKKQGFVQIGVKDNVQWADGSIASMHVFVLDLYALPLAV